MLADDFVLPLDKPWNKSQPGAPCAAASSGELSLPSSPMHPGQKGAFPHLLKNAVLTLWLPLTGPQADGGVRERDGSQGHLTDGVLVAPVAVHAWHTGAGAELQLPFSLEL